MSDTVFTHDGAVNSFVDSDGDGITVDDDGEATFSWDEIPIVRVDAPADLEGAFDTERFYKIEGATIARPIKQPYHVGDDVEVYKKPADELRPAAWSFDNAPFTLGHPDTGMVKDVDDIHGFWRNVRYLDDEDRLVEDLYIPETDDDARAFVEDNQDVSVGFFNRVYADYDGDTGDLADDDVDGFQVDIYGNHVAGVERGRCSSEQGCGLDAMHGDVHAIATDETTSSASFVEGADEIDDPSDSSTSFLTKEDQKERESEMTRQPRENTDQPSGIKSVGDEWFAVGPDEHTKESTDHPEDHMYPVGGCGNVDDAWKLRGSAEDLEIDQSTLEQRIIRAAEAQDCTNVPDTLQEQMDVADADTDCGCDADDTNTDDTNTNMSNDFDIPELSIDALVEQNDQVKQLRDERDKYEQTVEEIRDELDLDEDTCPCDVVPDLASERDDYEQTIEDARDALDIDEDADVAERAEDIADEWREYRADQRDERLDELESLGADRGDWDDATLDELDDEIERREEVLDEVDEASPTGVEGNTDEGGDDQETTVSGRRRFGRGHAAAANQ